MEKQRNQNIWKNFEEEESGSTQSTLIQAYFIATVIQTVWYWQTKTKNKVTKEKYTNMYN